MTSISLDDVFQPFQGWGFICFLSVDFIHGYVDVPLRGNCINMFAITEQQPIALTHYIIFIFEVIQSAAFLSPPIPDAESFP
jgi:hypothetical protein